MPELKHFTPDEFECPCCGANEMVPNFLLQLDDARHRAGVPFRITSGYRCAQRNAAVHGRPNSRHLTGTAVDIAWHDEAHLAAILFSLRAVGLRSFAIHPTKHFIHCDTAPVDWLGLYK